MAGSLWPQQLVAPVTDARELAADARGAGSGMRDGTGLWSSWYLPESWIVPGWDLRAWMATATPVQSGRAG